MRWFGGFKFQTSTEIVYNTLCHIVWLKTINRHTLKRFWLRPVLDFSGGGLLVDAPYDSAYRTFFLNYKLLRYDK